MMLQRIREIPDQIRSAWDRVSALKLPSSYGADLDRIVVLGMGGSAIGADLVSGLVRDLISVPVIVYRGYGLPAWADPSTLVVASSYSGSTEETLSGWNEAGRRRLRRIAITTGGPLAASARTAGDPLLLFHYDAQPRAAIGHSFGLVLGLLWKLGLSGDLSREMREAADFLEAAQKEWEPDHSGSGNRALRLAETLKDHVPVVFGAEHLAVIARRWANQFNENAKSWAFWAEMPELNHNLVAGLNLPAAIRGALHVLSLRSSLYQPRIEARFEATGRLLDEAVIPHSEIRAEGDHRLEEILWANSLGDYTSYHLALLNGVDPTPVDSIVRLKQELGSPKAD